MPMHSSSYIIGIAGGSGSGKSSFMNELKNEFTKDEVCFVSLDDYYHPREAQKTDENGVKNFDLPSSIDHHALIADLKLLKSGQSITKERYQFNNQLAEKESFTIDPAPIIFIEGLFIYHYAEVNDMFDLKLFIDASDNRKLIRRIKRDQIERNYPIEDVMYRYENHVMPSYKTYIEKHLEEIDMIINNNYNYKKSIEVVINHIKMKLSSFNA